MEKDERLSEAIKLYDVKQFDKALPLIKKFAKKNDPAAHYYLGMMALYGNGVKKDPLSAYESFQKSAMELDMNGLYMCGVCHANGFGTTKDDKKAFEYYQTAAEAGHIEAKIKMAQAYEIGFGIPKSDAKALKIYVELAKAEDAFAAYKIGTAYLEGKGVQKSPENAFSWLNKALSWGSIDAMNQFRLIGTKSKTDARTTSMMVKIGEELLHSDHPQDAIIYLQIGSNEGDVLAYTLLIEAYDQGIGVATDLKKAFEFCTKAANLNDPESMYRLAVKYELGQGVDSSFIKAAKWYEQSATAGYEPAKTALFSMRGY